MTQIAKHTFVIHNTEAIISTVQFSENEFETMVMYIDGDEIECIRTNNIEAAKRTHNGLVNKYNDRVYKGSTAKLLGVANCGQFVRVVKAC